MDQQLYCNLKKCRKKLKDYAWVTSCSHIFCDEDGYRKFGISRHCPVCETSLVDKYDFVHLPLNPNERMQTLSLCGFRPDVILDVCSRAIAFWVYQVHLEITYQEYVANKTKQRYKQLEIRHDDENGRVQVEISCLEQQLEVITKEIAAQKKNVGELNEKLSESHRESQRLQTTRDALRRRSTVPSQFETTDESFKSPAAFRPRFQPFAKEHSPFEPMEEGCGFLEQISRDAEFRQPRGDRNRKFAPAFDGGNIFTAFSENAKTGHKGRCKKWK